MKLLFPVLLLVAAPLAVFGQRGSEQCLRYGSGACCPDLAPLDVDLQDTATNQPTYVVFISKNDHSNYASIDNVCYTYFPVPDDSETFILYISRVYCDGTNEVVSVITSQTEPGARRFGSGLCSYADTAFAEVSSQASSERDCDVLVYNRCTLSGDCPNIVDYDSESTVFGLSFVRRQIGISCLNRAKAAIRQNGLPVDDYYILPMRLPSRCVLNQVCTIASGLQRFCQTVGVAFPSTNICANQYY